MLSTSWRAWSDDLRAELDARFALMAGELARLFTLLESTFRISAADGNAQAPPVHTREPKVSESSVDPLQQQLLSSPAVLKGGK